MARERKIHSVTIDQRKLWSQVEQDREPRNELSYSSTKDFFSQGVKATQE